MNEGTVKQRFIVVLRDCVWKLGPAIVFIRNVGGAIRNVISVNFKQLMWVRGVVCVPGSVTQLIALLTVT
jgi:hypothetical protein